MTGVMKEILMDGSIVLYVKGVEEANYIGIFEPDIGKHYVNVDIIVKDDLKCLRAEAISPLKTYPSLSLAWT